MIHAERYLKGCRPGFAFVAEKMVDATYEQALELYTHAPSLNDWELALLGANDRFFLLTELLNRVDALHPWIYERCREVEREPDGFLDLWARYHYKSTIITFAGSIEEILRDPEIKIGIFAATNKVAKPFLKQIMQEFESNDRLKKLYSDVLWEHPRIDAPYWSMANGIVVKRKGNPREPTLGAYGLIDGMPVGFHFDILDYDDLVTLELVTNEEMVKKTTIRWEMSDNLGVGASKTRKRAAGTRYSFSDTYGEVIEAGSLTPRIHAATDDGTLEGNPVFMSPEDWADVKRTQRNVVAAQMLQNPLAGKENTFDPQSLRPYFMRPRTLNVYIMGDPSQGKRKSVSGRSSDRTAIVVVGIDAAGNKYLLDGFCHRMRLTERWLKLKELYKKWTAQQGVQYVYVGWERYGLQADLEYFLEKMQAKDEVSFPITELNWTREGNESKKSRVQRLEPDFTANKFYVPAKVWRPNIAYTDGFGVEHRGAARTCLWKVNEETGVVEYRPIGYEKIIIDPTGDGRIVTKHIPGLTVMRDTPNLIRLPEEKRAIRDGELFLLTKPLLASDEDNSRYDLTSMFFDEYLKFPFSPRDDLIDAASRIYDMKPTKPEVLQRDLIDSPAYNY